MNEKTIETKGRRDERERRSWLDEFYGTWEAEDRAALESNEDCRPVPMRKDREETK